MGKLFKRITRTPAVQRLVSATAAGHIALVKRTTRWRVVNDAHAREAWAGARPVIVAFWHNRLAMMPYCWPSRRPFHMLISAHPDGRLIANAVRHFGIDTVAGSSTRGGTEALRALVRLVKGGASVGITPDGPRGPRMRASGGALALARLTGVPILPAAVSVSRRLVLDTWDRLIVALPFGNGAMVWGQPLLIPPDADEGTLAALRQTLEDELSRVSAEADHLAGHAPMTPAPQQPSPADARA